MTYEDKLKIYKHEYDIGYGIEGRERFKLLSLVCIIIRGVQAKTPETHTLDIIHKLCKGYANDAFKEALSIQCDALLTNGRSHTFDTYGFNKVPEMVAEVKRILDEWLPF